MRSRFLLLAFLSAALLVRVHAAFAAWPERPIRMIVPSAPGGAPDVLMRALTAQLSQQLGVPFIIDNKPGGSYVIGTMELVRAPADGYTLAYGNVISMATNKSLLAHVPYDADQDLTPVSGTWRVINMVVANKDAPFKTVPELVAYAKKNPGKINFASDGNGTTAHLGMELFKSMTGTHMVHVPYKAASTAVTDVMGGGVQLIMANVPVVLPQVQAGKLHALGVTAKARVPELPQVPAVAETVPGFEVVSWGGIVGPAKLPADVVARLNAEIRKALAMPAVADRFKALGAEPMATTPQEFRALAHAESVKWAQVIKTSGAKVD